jgi:hypothetical protein
MPKEIMLHELEDKAAEVGRLIGGSIPEGVGFCLTLFTFGDGGWFTYVSNAERGDMMRALEELLRKLRSHE